MSLKNKYIIPIEESLVRNSISNITIPVINQVIHPSVINIDYQGSQNYQNSIEGMNDYDAISLLGTPIYDTITLSYRNASYSGSNASIIGSDINLSCVFDVVQFTITQTRNIVTTPVNGLNGTIKEFISDGDYIVSCNATISFDGIDYIDYQELQNIQTLFMVQDDIQIESKIINNVFNLQNVVVKDYRFGQPQVGMRNVQTFSFSLLSDNPNNYNVIF